MYFRGCDEGVAALLAEYCKSDHVGKASKGKTVSAERNIWRRTFDTPHNNIYDVTYSNLFLSSGLPSAISISITKIYIMLNHGGFVSLQSARSYLKAQRC